MVSHESAYIRSCIADFRGGIQVTLLMAFLRRNDRLYYFFESSFSFANDALFIFPGAVAIVALTVHVQ